MKRVLITGIGGQDGSYLADLLLEKGYEVHGLVRRSSTGNLRNISHCLDRITLHQGDITDYGRLEQIVGMVMPNEVYHEADQDNVDWSFKTPSHTIDTTIKGTHNLLEAVKRVNEYGVPNTRVFIPCSSTMFGDATPPQNETTVFNPQSPYACAKVSVYHLARYYRQVYKMFVVVGILYNHDSVRRYGDEYLLHKICKSAVLCKKDNTTRVKFWDLDSMVAVGIASNIVDGIYRTMQLEIPGDYVLGNPYRWPVSSYLEHAFNCVGLDYRDYVLPCDRQRPGLVENLVPDLTKISRIGGWEPQDNPRSLIGSLVSRYIEELK